MCVQVSKSGMQLLLVICETKTELLVLYEAETELLAFMRLGLNC